MPTHYLLDLGPAGWGQLVCSASGSAEFDEDPPSEPRGRGGVSCPECQGRVSVGRDGRVLRHTVPFTGAPCPVGVR